MTAERKPQNGLHRKYYGLRRTRDDSEVEGWYFVLREDDRHSDAALAAYADSCADEFPELAADLRKIVWERQFMDALYESQWER